MCIERDTRLDRTDTIKVLSSNFWSCGSDSANEDGLQEFLTAVGTSDSDCDRSHLCDAAYRHEFDCVLFWSLDRFSREGVLETLKHFQRLTSYNVAFKSFTEQYLDGTSVFRDAIIGILAALAVRSAYDYQNAPLPAWSVRGPKAALEAALESSVSTIAMRLGSGNCAKMGRVIRTSLMSWEDR